MKELQFTHREDLINNIKLGDILELKSTQRCIKIFTIFKSLCRVGGYVFSSDNHFDKKNTFKFLRVDSDMNLYFVHKV